MKLKDFCAILSLKNQTGHCYRSVDRTADVHRCAVCISYYYGGKGRHSGIVGVQLIFWSVLFVARFSK